MSFHTIRQKLLRGGKLFHDKDFPPDDTSLYISGNYNPNRPIIWKRAKNAVVLPNKATFITAGATRFDLAQGSLGDCWFVAAAATLATKHQKQFKRVVPTDQSFENGEYAGIFRFYFWYFGKWEEVIVDDFLPFDVNGWLVYCRNRDSRYMFEFWPALLEKAYAKFHGCYEALDGGTMVESLLDLTGGITEFINLQKPQDIPNDLYLLMARMYKMNSFMAGGIFNDTNGSSQEVKRPNGLYSGHAYSITGLARVPFQGRTHELVRLRNPWGRGEWNGAWSDVSHEMSSLDSSDKRNLNLVVKDDGEFWMPLTSFIDNFNEITFCHMEPDALAKEVAIDTAKRDWKMVIYKDKWVHGRTAGGANSPFRNPQFYIKLLTADEMDSGHCTLVVSLIKNQSRLEKSIAIGFYIYRLDNDRLPTGGSAISSRDMTYIEQSGIFQHHREKCVRYNLRPGVYAIIPCTYYPNMESKFMIRLFTGSEIESSPSDGSDPIIVDNNKPDDMAFDDEKGDDEGCCTCFG